MDVKANFVGLPVLFSSESTSHHFLYLKEHVGRSFDETKPSGKTLFVGNVPPYATEDSLRRIFAAAAGKVRSVVLQKGPSVESNVQTGFKVAYIVFETSNSLLKALKLKTIGPLSTEQDPIPMGMSKWIRSYNSNIYNHERLNTEVNAYMAKHEEEKKKESKKEEEVDDEGWTVVTKKGRNPGIARKESVQSKIISKNKRKSLKKQLKNFYTFQQKEQKIKNIVALRKSFQESKDKVNAMKQKRNFRPLANLK